VVNELATTIDTSVILFTSAFAVFANMRRLAFWALHLRYPQFIPLIMQRQIIVLVQLWSQHPAHLFPLPIS